MARTASRTTSNLGSQPLRGADFERAHSSVVLGEDVRDQRRGFTIIELLIVVVVVAILAAVTVVAYNGITNRAKATAAATAAEQAARKVLAYAAVNSDQYPASLSDAGVNDGPASYQYRVDNSASPKTFCVTATSSGVSYWASSTSGAPAVGACAGHVAPGQTLITNLVTNPRAVTDSTGALVGWSSEPAVTLTPIPGGGVRATTSGGSQSAKPTVSVMVPGEQYTISARIRSVNGGGIQVYGTSPNPVWRATTSWTEFSATVNATQSTLYLALYGGAAGSGFELDRISVVRGSSLYPYADGGSPGWAWTGAANNSTSTGPAF